MGKNKALSLLESLLDEIPRLRRLDYKNTEFNTWDQRVKEILRETFGGTSKEYTRYNGIMLLKHVYTEEDKKQAYIDFLNKREAALKSIIEKYKTIGDRCKDFAANVIAKFLAEKTK
jgi:hypothetical protein